MKGLFSVFLVFISAALHSEDFRTPLELTSPPMNGIDILAVQTKLLELGFTQLGEADGWFGPMTSRAVADFQRYVGLGDTGSVEKPTWDSLFSSSPEMLKVKDAIKKANASLADLTKTSRDVMDRSTEGGTVDDYFSGGSLVSQAFTFYGEIGKWEFKVILVDGGMVVLEKDYRYPQPFDLEHAETDTTAYYFTDGLSLKIHEGAITKATKKELFFEDLIGKTGP